VGDAAGDAQNPPRLRSRRIEKRAQARSIMEKLGHGPD